MDEDTSFGLTELSRRRGVKPYDVLREGDTYAEERTIFHDAVTRAEIWRMTHDPEISRHVYYDIPAWNADGSMLYFVSRRRGGVMGNWLINADGSGVRELRVAGEKGRVLRPMWSVTDPKKMFYQALRSDCTALCSVNVKTGRRREIALVDLVYRVELCPPSSDERKLLVRGVRDPDKKEWTIYLIDVETGEKKLVPIEGNVHRLRFTRAADHTIFYNTNDPVKEVRLGSYRCDADGGNVVDLPVGKAGHPDWSPDGGRLSFTSEGAVWLIDRDGTNKRQLLNMATGMHGGWSLEGGWIVADSPDRGPYANQIIRVHTEEPGRVHRICHHNASYQGWGAMHPDAESTHPAPVSSPDGTKAVFDSDGASKWAEMYVVVMRKPDAPQDLRAEKRGRVVSLKWRRPERGRELAGYYVYRSAESGDGFEQVGRAAAGKERFEDRPQGRGPWYYRVSAHEHCGLEGLPSDEVRVGGAWREPARVYVDAAFGERLGMTDLFDGRTQSLYCVGLKDGVDSGRVTLTLRAPKSGRFYLWARVSAAADGSGEFAITCDAEDAGAARAVTGEWLWVRALDEQGRPVALDLEQGERTLTVATRSRGARLDRLLATDDFTHVPRPRSGVDATAPAKPTGVRVAPRGTDELEVTWEPSDDPDFQRYNVYADRSPDLELCPRTLIASPSVPRLLDWGLPCDTPHWSSTVHYYRVTAVDRSGNESEPSDAAEGRTGIPRGALRAAALRGPKK